MNNNFYGFSQSPFARRVELQPVFSHEAHRRARSSLEYALMNATSMVIIAGEQGIGKHTLINDLLSRYPLNDLEVRQFSAADCGDDTLLDQIVSEFGIDLPSSGEDCATSALRSHLDGKQAEGKKSLLVIHDADRLNVKDLEELKALISASDKPNTLHIYLAGLPDIQQLINDFTDKHPLGDAVSHIRVEPILSAQETAGYIKHRLKAAGWDGNPEISDDALSRVHSDSGGIPGTINRICHRLLQNGAATGKPTLDAADVKLAAGQVMDESDTDKTRSSIEETQSTALPHARLTSEREETAAPMQAVMTASRADVSPYRESTSNAADAESAEQIAPLSTAYMTARPPADEDTFSGRKPEHKKSPWRGLFLLTCLIILILAAGAYWDLSNTRRLMEIKPVADALHSLGLLPLLQGPVEQPDTAQANSLDIAGNPRKTNSTEPDSPPPSTESGTVYTPSQPLTPAEEAALATSQITDVDAMAARAGSNTGYDEPAAVLDAGTDIIPRKPRPVSPLDKQLEADLTDRQERQPPQDSATLPPTAEQAASSSPTFTPPTQPTDSDPDEASLQKTEAEEPAVPRMAGPRMAVPRMAVPRMALLLPTTRPGQRYIDIGLIDRGRELIISPALGDALQPYVEQLLWRSDGTLEVIPKGLDTPAGDYDPLELQESVDGIAFVIRNFRGVGLLVRTTGGIQTSNPEIMNNALQARELVESRLRNRRFASQEVSLVADPLRLADSTTNDEGLPRVRLLVVPHR